MMMIRRAGERGHAQHGWLDSHHTFSFADYHDPKFMGFRALRVINEDRVAAGKGFGTHGHRDMEIVSYVVEGALEHRDSIGTGAVMRPGDVQRMSAGSGVMHSEFNSSKTDLVHFLQIWIMPAKNGIAPSYEQKTFGDSQKKGRLAVVASPDAREGSVTIHADAVIMAGIFDNCESAVWALDRGRGAWVQVVRGKVRVNGEELTAGDGAAFTDETAVRIDGVERGEILLFDLA